ncbi:MAG: 8-oxo-dGTP diphosphatase [Micromonosporaceae bacterium]|nr:8-oxo-dGTP diphosphatase [Micromonosporaceae bacterium]
MERRRQIEAYGLCRDDQARVLLIPDRWALPGDIVAHGEHPATTVTRAFAALGLRIAVEGVREVITDLDREPDGPAVTHHDRLIFDVRAVSGVPITAAWVEPEEAAALPPQPFTARALGIAWPDTSDGLAGVPGPGPLAATVVPLKPPARHQRFAAYGLVTDPDGHVLLTRIAEGYPGAGRWHLPGGGTDFGETAAAGLLRELVEETDQRGHITGLLTVSHRHQRGAVGPEEVAIDWHGVRVVFRALVDRPTRPRVMEGAGSTQDAEWFDPAKALALDLTDVAHEAVTKLTHSNAR